MAERIVYKAMFFGVWIMYMSIFIPVAFGLIVIAGVAVTIINAIIASE